MQAVMNMSANETKLRPLSCFVGTALLSLGGAKVAETMIDTVKKSGIKDVIIVGADKDVRDYLGDGSEKNVRITYVGPSDAVGALKRAEKYIENDFVYFSKPVYSDVCLDEAIKSHREKSAYVSVVETYDERYRGVITGKMTRLEEGRLWNRIAGEEHALGLYILKKEVLEFMPGEEKSEMFTNIFPAIIRSGKNVYVVKIPGACEPIHDIASYMRAIFLMCDRLKKRYDKGVRVESGARIEQGALVEGPCYIGKNVHVHAGAKISAYSVLGEGCVVQSGASVKRSVVLPNCRIGKDAVLRGCILDEGVTLCEKATVFEQAVIGRNSKIGTGSTVKSFVKIWPEKSIEENSIVRENIMWGQKERTKLYHKGQIQGVINRDITPSFAVRLGECAGMCFDMGAVAVSSDGSPAGAMIRDGIVSGLLGMGCTVKDFGEQPVPITRRGVVFYMLSGGICISVSEIDGEELCEIAVLKADGTDADKKIKERLEEYFQSGDFLFPEGREIKECEYVFEYKIHYLKALVEKTNKKYNPCKVLVSCPSVWGRRLLVSALGDFSAMVSVYEPFVTTNEDVIRFTKGIYEGGFDIGFIMDGKCEKLKVVLGSGKVIEDETYEVFCALMVMKKCRQANIYVPYTASNVVEKLGEKYACNIVRTKDAAGEITRRSVQGDKSAEEQYVLKYDAVGAVIKIMDFIHTEKPEDLLEEIGPIYIAHTTITMPKKETEHIMRNISNIKLKKEAAGSGVKITLDKGWVVVLPDSEKEVCSVSSEGVTMEAARELCDLCLDMLQ